ncbi:MAG: hypothetical protein JRE47_15180 [Deltaproteobacteria bacterium]|nr:hypothetical protein [Deltaproteobacteria bacterium]
MSKTNPWSCFEQTETLHGSINGVLSLLSTTTFSKSADKVDKKNDIYALWSILNHPLASLWFHERQRVQTIPTKNYRKFALPANWNIENIQLLASIAKDLVTTKRNMSSKLHEPHDNLKIKTIVKKIDDIIYQMYEINEGERRCIEAWFGEEQRPLLEGICQRKTFAEPTNNLIRINYEVPEWETTCETLELCFKDNLIRLVIDGLMDDSEDIESAEDGIWLKIIPAMPGWLLEKEAVGWVELTTDSVKRLKQSPEEYIVGFHLHKNAYKTQDEVDKNLQSILDTEIKKAEVNG